MQTPLGREEEGLRGRNSFKSFWEPWMMASTLKWDSSLIVPQHLGAQISLHFQRFFLVPTFDTHSSTYLVEYSYVDGIRWVDVEVVSNT